MQSKRLGLKYSQETPAFKTRRGEKDLLFLGSEEGRSAAHFSLEHSSSGRDNSNYNLEDGRIAAWGSILRKEESSGALGYPLEG